MRQKLSAICCFGIIGAGAAIAQSGPAELPPEDFAGRQYIDSKGCIYLRTTRDTGVVWEPRTLTEGEVMCGFAPTFPFLEPKDGSDPMDQVVVIPKTPVEPEVQEEEPQAAAEVEPDESPAPVVEMPKPAEAEPKPLEEPVTEPEVVDVEEEEPSVESLADLDSVETEASTEKEVVEPEVAEELEEAAKAQPEPVETEAPVEAASAQPEPVQPNETVVPEPKPEPAPVVTSDPVETATQPEEVAQADWSKGTYLQIAAFRQRENTLKTKAKIEDIGLQIAIETVQSQGRPLEVVLVGPFADSEAAKDALRAVRRAGYKDAFTRRN